MRLTKRRIEAISAETHEVFVWDEDLAGFGVRVYPTGRRAFLVQYRAKGHTRRVALGVYGVVTAEQARKKARAILGDVARGEDPGELRAIRRHAQTVAELCSSYLELHARTRKRSYQDDEQRVRRYIGPAWGRQKAVDVSRRDVIELHRKIGEAGRPYLANRIVALVSSIWGWAEREERLPLGHPNPARGVSRFPEKSRDRWLTAAEVKRLAEALSAEPNEYVRAYFTLAMLTGARKRELLAIQWQDVKEGLLRFGKTKNGEPHLIPLSNSARAVFDSLSRRGGNPYVFSSSVNTGEPLAVVTIDQAWRRIRGQAGIQDVRIHDLRRTLGSWMAQRGVSLPMIGRALNHKSLAATAIYARLALDGIRDELEAHAVALAKAGLIRSSRDFDKAPEPTSG